MYSDGKYESSSYSLRRMKLDKTQRFIDRDANGRFSYI